MKWVAIVLAAMLAADFAAAANVSLEVRLPGEVMLGRVYTSLFRIDNLDYRRGVDSYVNVTVNYNVTWEDGSLYYGSSFSKLVNSYSYASTGYLFMDELGKFQLCGFSEGASACGNFTVIDPMTIPCSVSVNISAEKFIYSNGERVEFENELYGNGNDNPFVIEYWIEGLLGNIEKKPVNTSNLNTKTFTPKTDEIDRVYVLKNRLAYVGCNNSNQNITSTAYFVVKNQDYKERKDVQEECPAAPAKKAAITSFYTLTKKYHDEINIYANVKADQGALLLLKEKSREEWRKVNSSGKLAFLVEADPGLNFYQLEIYVNDRLEDEKSLAVTLEEDKKPAPLAEAPKANASINTSTPERAAIAENKSKMENNSAEASPSGMVVYESPGEKARGWAVYLAAFAAAAAAIGLLAHARR